MFKTDKNRLVLAIIVVFISAFTFLTFKLTTKPTVKHSEIKDTLKVPLPRPKPTQLVFRLAENLTLDYPATIGDLEFARLVEQKSQGRIKIIVYYGAKLGDEKTVIEQVQFGGIDFARINAAPLSEVYKTLRVLSLPYLFRDSNHLWNVLYGPIGKELLEGFKGTNLVGLTYYSSAARSFYTKRPVRSIMDMRGLKIRVQQSSIYVDLVKALGAEPVPISFGDVYNALLMGEIDGAENNWSSYYAVKHYQLAKYYTLDTHTRTPEVLLASKQIMDKLTPADQKLIFSAAQESVAFQWKASAAKERATEIEVRKEGSTLITLNWEQKNQFMKAVAPLYQIYTREYADLIARIKKVK